MTISAAGSAVAVRAGEKKRAGRARGADQPEAPDSAARGGIPDPRNEAEPSGPIARISGVQAVGAGALALFAPLAILLLSATETPSWTFLIAVAAAAPLIVVAGVALIRPTPPSWFAAALAPLALGAAWFAWATSAALPAPASPAAPWVFAAVAGAALLGGRAGAVFAALLSVTLGAAFVVIEPPAQNLQYLTLDEDFGANRRLIAALSWSFALLALAAAAWTATVVWTRALPPLRRPTINARRALSMLAEDGAVSGLRVSKAGVVVQAIGAPERALDLPRDDLRGIDVKSLAHPDDLPQIMAMVDAAHARAERARDGAQPEPLKLPDPKSPPPPKTATVRLRSRTGAYEWVEVAAAPASAYPEPPRVAADAKDAVLVIRARWRGGDAVASDAHSADAAFLAQMNSQLRDSVKSIHGYTEILTNEIFGPLGSERYREYAKLAHGDASKMLGLVDELLDLAEIEAGRFVSSAELIDPVPLIDGAVRNLSQTAERLGVALAPQFPPNAPYIRVDRRALRRALAGLGLDGVRRADIGDQVALRIDVEEGAVRFSVVVTRRAKSAPPLEADAPTMARLAPPAHPSGAASSAAPHSPEEEATRESLHAAARLSRLVARNLVERMNGAIFIAPDTDQALPNKPLIASEAIFETPKGVSADERDAQKPRLLVKAAAAVGFAPDDEEAQAAAERARVEAEAAEERVKHPLFATGDAGPEGDAAGEAPAADAAAPTSKKAENG